MRERFRKFQDGDKTVTDESLALPVFPLEHRQFLANLTGSALEQVGPCLGCRTKPDDGSPCAHVRADGTADPECPAFRAPTSLAVYDRVALTVARQRSRELGLPPNQADERLHANRAVA